MAKWITVRPILDVAVIQGWHTHQTGVKNAFLYGVIKDIVYMKLPHGYKKQSSDMILMDQNKLSQPTNNNTKSCRLLKSLYGLKQASRQWFTKLSSVLKRMGLHNLGLTIYSL